MMPSTTRLLTHDEVRALPDLSECYELINGILIVPPTPPIIHARLVQRLIGIVDDALSPLGLRDYLFTAPCDVRMGDQLSVQPDLFYVPPYGPAKFTPECIVGPPTLVIEILSPSSRYHDLETKFDVYERAGVAEYWTVDPQYATLTVNSLVDGRFVKQVHHGVTARSVVIPGLTVDIPAIFTNLARGIVE